MALSEKDKQDIAEMVAQAMAAGPQSYPNADQILALIQAPNLRVYPGPQRSRYSQVTLLDKDEQPCRQLRVRTSDLRNLLLAAYNDEPGEAIEPGGAIPVIAGPKG